MKVVVLAGGTSTERDVSIVSGRCVCEALQKRGHKAILLDVFFGCSDAEAENAFASPVPADEAAERIKDRNPELEEAVASRRSFFGPNVIKLCSEADKVFMALHGANGEDGKVQAAFELFGIKYTGAGHLPSAIAMDKDITKSLFMLYGINVPKGGVLRRTDEDMSYKKMGLSLPVVVKPCCGGSSVGTSIVHTDDEYGCALEESFVYEEKAVVEEYIKGREFSVAVIGGKAFPVIEIAPINGFYDYKNKYSEGATIETCPADIPEDIKDKMQKMAEKGAEVLGIKEYCRLDFIMNDDGELFCLEINTLPGMTPLSLVPQEAAALGIDFPDICEKLLML